MTSPLPYPFTENRATIRRAEEAAAACLVRCQRSRKLATIPLPPPIETWIESPCGYRLEYEANLTRSGVPVDGVAFLGERRMVIAERLVHSESRLRYVLAHELGHLEMHTAADYHEQCHVHRNDPEWAFRRSNPFERQADRFAAACLMPPALLAREFFAICEERRLSSKATIVELMTGTDKATDLWKAVFIPEISRRFGVSRAAALFRLSDLRVFDNAPLMLTRHAIQFLEIPA